MSTHPGGYCVECHGYLDEVDPAPLCAECHTYALAEAEGASEERPDPDEVYSAKPAPKVDFFRRRSPMQDNAFRRSAATSGGMCKRCGRPKLAWQVYCGAACSAQAEGGR